MILQGVNLNSSFCGKKRKVTGSHQRGGFPDVEGEIYGVWVGFNFIVPDENDLRGDFIGRDGTRVKAEKWLAEDEDWGGEDGRG
ncbi:hypothetical protein HAX54_037183 [Datura stramonium]|uniref:Uncharacterized protein n=1 Tax=Datura stramonium TaxID=4076 RepID=A0ABS8SH15_DATST|nr:hypothetical protein [Datura stramonium]